MVRRVGAKPGDLLLISGPIGDAWLGLQAAQKQIPDADGQLERCYRLPQPRLDLRAIVLERATAAADVSDGLIADAGHIAAASGVRLTLDLDRMPISPQARGWLDVQSDRTAALLGLATGGDDYEIVATAAANLPGFTVIGEVAAGGGIEARIAGRGVEPGAGGWRHT